MYRLFLHYSPLFHGHALCFLLYCSNIDQKLDRNCSITSHLFNWVIMELPAHHPFRSAKARERYLALYDARAKRWPIPSQIEIVETTYGQTFVRISGATDSPPSSEYKVWRYAVRVCERADRLAAGPVPRSGVPRPYSGEKATPDRSAPAPGNPAV